MLPWPLKAALVIGLVVGLGVELGRPAVARLELHDVARDAADVAEADLLDHGRGPAQLEARRAVEAGGARLIDFAVDRAGRVEVRVARDVEPLVLGGLSAVDTWYDVEVGARSDGALGG